MKRWLVLVMVSIFLFGLIGCNKPVDEEAWNQDIYHARDYAMSVFKDTMPEDYVIVQSKGSIGDNAEDSIYIIKFTYTIGDDDTHLYYTYKVSVEGTNCTIVEEYAEW